MELVANLENRYKLIWLGSSSWYAHWIHQFTPPQVESKVVDAALDLQSFGSDQDIVSILINQIEDLSFLSDYSKPIIYIYENLIWDDILSLKNRFSTIRFIQKNEVSNKLSEAINFELSLLKEKRREENYYKNLIQQNKEIEKLTSNLESKVLERTQDISLSAEEEQKKLNQIKNVIGFIKDLPDCYSIDELFNRLRKDFKKFHKLGEMFLFVKNVKGQSVLYSFRSGLLHSQKLSEDIQFSKSKVNHDSSFKIANIIRRPIVKLLNYPIEFTFLEDILHETPIAHFFLEHDMNEKELLEFDEYFEGIFESFKANLEKIILEDYLSVYSYRWEKTFDALQDPIAIIDSDYNVLRSNRSFSQELNKKCYESFGQESPCEACPFKSTLQTGHEQDSIIYARDKIYEVHSYPIITQDSKSERTTVNYYVDITHNQKLKMRGHQNEKMAAIGQLAGNITHELNNPLSGLRSLAQVLLKEVDSSLQLHGDLQEIEKATARAQQIIKNLVDFSLGEEPKSVLFNVDDVVEKTLPICKALLRYIQTDIQLETKEFYTLGDPNLLQQVVFNLINNASQAMGKKGRLYLKTWVMNRENKKYIVLSVKDSGPGIEKEVLQKIFEPFFTTKKVGQGTGLGLSISNSIIEKMQGFMNCESTPGSGAEFFVYLPLVEGKS